MYLVKAGECLAKCVQANKEFMVWPIELDATLTMLLRHTSSAKQKPQAGILKPVPQEVLTLPVYAEHIGAVC